MSEEPIDRETGLAAYTRYLLDAAELETGRPGTPAPVAKPHLLVITDYVPTPDADAGSFRLVHLLALWQELGHRVTLACDQPAGNLKYVADLERLGVTVITTSAQVDCHLKNDGARYEVVVLCRPDTALKYLFSTRAYAVRARVMYDTVDLHWVRMEGAARLNPSDPSLAERAAFYARVEPFVSAMSDVVLTVTEVEKETLLALNPALRVEVVPCVHPDGPAGAPWSRRKDLLFIGGFWHQPNVDAVCYFVEDVLPTVRAALPDVVFNIIGSNMPDRVKALASPSVRPLGFVEDVAPHFLNSRVFVAPLRFGAGMKGKVGHSMSHGLPVVTTSIGAEGMSLTDGETVMLADDPSRFAEAVIRLYTDEAMWTAMSARSRDHIEKHFSIGATKARLERIFAMPAAEASHDA